MAPVGSAELVVGYFLTDLVVTSLGKLPRGHIQDIFWTSSVHLIHILCPGGKDYIREKP